MDESFKTIGNRFDSIGVENTEENRRAYRELVLTTPGLGISYVYIHMSDIMQGFYADCTFKNRKIHLGGHIMSRDVVSMRRRWQIIRKLTERKRYTYSFM